MAMLKTSGAALSQRWSAATGQKQADIGNMKLFRFFFFLIFASVVLALLMWAWSEVSIDRCLDSGGRWNKENSDCDGVPR